eukprot:scaffold992_cov175-Amphora_coffeaeformis.AAC.1
METDHEDEEYEPNIDDIGTPTGYALRRRRTEDGGMSGRDNSGRKKLKSSPTNQGGQNRLPNDRRSISNRLRPLRREMHGTHYDRHLSLRVIHAALKLQDDYLLTKAKHPERPTPPPHVRDTICALFGISSATYSSIMKDYFTKSIYTSSMRGNASAKQTRIPETNEVVILICEFVRDQRRMRRRVTARQVLDLLLKKEIIRVPRKDNTNAYEKTAFATAYRNVRRWLSRHDYRRGKRSGNIRLKEHVAFQRDLYLKTFFNNKSLPINEQLRECYLDESYIHQHYHKCDDSLFDPQDDEDVQHGKQPAKGNCYCFLAAIQGPNPQAFQYDDAVDDKEARLLDKLKLEQLSNIDRGGVVAGT